MIRVSDYQTTHQTHINPLLPAEDRNQFRVRLQGLKVILVIDFRSVRVQMYLGPFDIAELFRRLPLKLLEARSDHGFLDLSRDILDL